MDALEVLVKFPRSLPKQQVLRRYLAQTTKDIAQAHRLGSKQN
jgi:hypothetical protein